MSKGGPNSKPGRKPLDPGQRKQPLTVRLPPPVLDWLTAQVEASGQSRAEIIQEAIARLRAYRDRRNNRSKQ